MATLQSLMFIGMVFETIIIIIATFLLLLILKRYFVKKHRLTFYLFIIFLNWLLAIIFSWLSKVLVLYSGLDYLAAGTTHDPRTPLSWILFRIIDFRISFMFVTIGTTFSYILMLNVFDREFSKNQKTLIYIYGIFTAFYSLIIYQRGVTILDVFAFLFLLILISIVYIPFMISSFKYYKSVSDPEYKKAFLSLALMSLSFILVLLMFLIDRILILFGDPGFTIFYFMAWTFVIIGFLEAYLGYIKPKSKG
ncbi:MAG: hypothetical protein ACFFDK_10615 [Promethearchaeota archaeon]